MDEPLVGVKVDLMAVKMAVLKVAWMVEHLDFSRAVLMEYQLVMMMVDQMELQKVVWKVGRTDKMMGLLKAGSKVEHLV